VKGPLVSEIALLNHVKNPLEQKYALNNISGLRRFVVKGRASIENCPTAATFSQFMLNSFLQKAHYYQETWRL
jgi:hypothetical protein